MTQRETVRAGKIENVLLDAGEVSGEVFRRRGGRGGEGGGAGRLGAALRSLSAHLSEAGEA